jgi:hypothetical protein
VGTLGAGDMGTASWGFSRLVSAIIIVSAVVFGLACGTIVGCLLVRLYNMQHGHSGACRNFLNCRNILTAENLFTCMQGLKRLHHKVWKI